MEPQFKSSFIPKRDSVVSAVDSGRTQYRKSSAGLLDKLATGLFVLTLLVWGGLFGYQKYIESSITKLEQEIASARSLIDQDKVDLFVALGKQISIAKELLAQHISLTPLFELLEGNTIPSVQFTDFDFDLDERGDLLVELIGRAKTFADVVRQEEVLLEVENLQKLSVDTVEVSESLATGGVSFKTTFIVPRQSVLYQELVKDLIAPPVVEEEETQAADTAADQDVDQAIEEIDQELDNSLNELESF